MRIVAVCGSFRGESNTNKLIRIVAEASGIDCEFIELGGSGTYSPAADAFHVHDE